MGELPHPVAGWDLTQLRLLPHPVAGRYLTQLQVGILPSRGLLSHPSAGRYLTHLQVVISPSRGSLSHPPAGRNLTQSRVVISPSRGSLSHPLAGLTHPVVGRYLTQWRVVISPSRGSLSRLVAGRNLIHSWVVISLVWARFIADSKCTRNIFRACYRKRAASLFHPRTLPRYYTTSLGMLWSLALWSAQLAVDNSSSGNECIVFARSHRSESCKGFWRKRQEQDFLWASNKIPPA